MHFGDENSRAWLRVWSPALLVLAAPLGMQCDPRSLGKSPFSAVNARPRIAFFCEEYSIFLFSPPLCLEKGPTFPDFPTASLESERRSGKLDRRRVTPQCPASFTPHELKHPGLKALGIGQSSSAVQLPTAAVGITAASPKTHPLSKVLTRKAHTQQHAVEICRQGHLWSIQIQPDEIYRAFKRRDLPPRDGLGTGCRVNRINQDDDPFLSTPVQWRRARSPPRLEPQQHPPRLLVDQAP